MEKTIYKLIDIDANAWECQNCKCAWCLLDGTPRENRMRFCPFCGAKIVGEIYDD